MPRVSQPDVHGGFWRKQATATFLLCVAGLSLASGSSLQAAEPPSPLPSTHQDQRASVATPPAEDAEQNTSHLRVIPVPADPELEAQLKEVQEALQTVHEQLVRRKQLVKGAVDPTAKANLYQEIEQLRMEHDKLGALLNDLVNEARASERTMIDEALTRARWLERQQESWQRKEESLRDRQQ